MDADPNHASASSAQDVNQTSDENDAAAPPAVRDAAIRRVKGSSVTKSKHQQVSTQQTRGNRVTARAYRLGHATAEDVVYDDVEFYKIPDNSEPDPRRRTPLLAENEVILAHVKTDPRCVKRVVAMTIVELGHERRVGIKVLKATIRDDGCVPVEHTPWMERQVRSNSVKVMDKARDVKWFNTHIECHRAGLEPEVDGFRRFKKLE